MLENNRQNNDDIKKEYLLKNISFFVLSMKKHLGQITINHTGKFILVDGPQYLRAARS